MPGYLDNLKVGLCAHFAFCFTSLALVANMLAAAFTANSIRALNASHLQTLMHTMASCCTRDCLCAADASCCPDSGQCLYHVVPLSVHWHDIGTCCRAPKQLTGSRPSGQTPTGTPLTFWTPSSTSVSCPSYGGPGGPSMQVSPRALPA